jgi:hypothetical protein
MAPGSQSWRGHWALLVAAPTNISTNAATTVPSWLMVVASAIRRLQRQMPVWLPKRRIPPSRARPPRPVVKNACMARFPASASSRSHPIRRNELIAVSSQNRTVSNRWSARTTPSMALVKNPRVGKNRASDASSGPK